MSVFLNILLCRRSFPGCFFFFFLIEWDYQTYGIVASCGSFCWSPQWPLLLVCQVCWRWYRLCFSWGTCLSRRSVTLIRHPCLTTLVHTFTQTHHHHHHHGFLCTCCLSLSVWLKLSKSFNILQYDPHVSPPAAQKVCHLLSINVTDFTRAILSPRIKVCITINTWRLLEIPNFEMFIILMIMATYSSLWCIFLPFVCHLLSCLDMVRLFFTLVWIGCLLLLFFKF